jgi:hypothetical protein
MDLRLVPGSINGIATSIRRAIDDAKAKCGHHGRRFFVGRHRLSEDTLSAGQNGRVDDCEGGLGRRARCRNGSLPVITPESTVNDFRNHLPLPDLT